MQNLEWYLADLKSTGKNTIETVEKSLTDMFIRLVRIYPCLYVDQNTKVHQISCNVRGFAVARSHVPSINARSLKQLLLEALLQVS